MLKPLVIRHRQTLATGTRPSFTTKPGLATTTAFALTILWRCLVGKTKICSEGVCVVDDGSDPCLGVVCDEPPAATCNGNATVTYADTGVCNAGECFYEPTETPCGENTSCSNGVCLDDSDPCAGVNCTEPPADACFGNIAIAYPAIGVCNDGICAYPSTETECGTDEACEAGQCVTVPDPCAEVVCDTPPAATCDGNSVVTYATTGTCVAGECTYESAGTDACAATETCSNGVCVPSTDPCAEVSCNAPPADACNGNSAVNYPATGVCNDGECTYTPTETPCASTETCAQGACLVVDPCEGVTCASPPADFCNGNSAVTYSSAGTCNEGDCNYASTTEACGDFAFCESGACVPTTETKIVINEIYYNPPTTQGDDLDYEFLELYNAGQTVNLENWVFTSGITHTFEAITFESGTFLLLVNRPEKLRPPAGYRGGVGFRQLEERHRDFDLKRPNRCRDGRHDLRRQSGVGLAYGGKRRRKVPRTGASILGQYDSRKLARERSRSRIPRGGKQPCALAIDCLWRDAGASPSAADFDAVGVGRPERKINAVAVCPAILIGAAQVRAFALTWIVRIVGTECVAVQVIAKTGFAEHRLRPNGPAGVSVGAQSAAVGRGAKRRHRTHSVAPDEAAFVFCGAIVFCGASASRARGVNAVMDYAHRVIAHVAGVEVVVGAGDALALIVRAWAIGVGAARVGAVTRAQASRQTVFARFIGRRSAPVVGPVANPGTAASTVVHAGDVVFEVYGCVACAAAGNAAQAWEASIHVPAARPGGQTNFLCRTIARGGARSPFMQCLALPPSTTEVRLATHW